MPGRKDKSPELDRPEYLLLGEVLRPHGIRGELRMRVLTDYPERIATLEQVFVGTNPEDPNKTSYAVEHLRMHHEYGLLKLKGVDDRNQAELLRDLFIMVGIEHAVPLEDDEVYLYQLIGIEVRTDVGDVLGTISDVLETGANDVYIVDSPTYGEILIPITSHTLLETNIDEGFVLVKLPEGLLPT
ncbi:MAG: 16S rRNA processing protein RimM [Chitinophagaceae bacterium]|nr:16S rRNA processing protein RimM [Anaerolineae bacterium]